MNQVRIGIIGLGHIGTVHADYLRRGEIARATLTAVCTRTEPKLNAYRKACTVFSRGSDLIHSGAIDAVIIATPHPDHVPTGIAALEQGLHVLVEKPLASCVADARPLVDAHQNPHCAFAIAFNLRTDPLHRTLKSLVADGRLGTLQRVSLIVTEWFRTNAYYASSSWRGRWKGEGGGMLINQYAHHLDLLQWICGMPVRLRAVCAFGKHHPIEVEDEATAYLEWENGATGVFVGSTGEAPGTNRFEIVGDLGTAILEKGRLTLFQNSLSANEFGKTSSDLMAKPDCRTIDLTPPETGSRPQNLTQNFVDAILDGTPLIAPAEDGLQSLGLANAMIQSSVTDQTVALPLEPDEYLALLKGLRK